MIVAVTIVAMLLIAFRISGLLSGLILGATAAVSLQLFQYLLERDPHKR